MNVVALFAGIGGIELGLHKNGFQTELFCEILDEARIVLSDNFPNIPIHTDVTTLKSIPKVDLLTAGFPCQDLSMAGKKQGISGINSSLVGEVFRLIKNAKNDAPNFILIENVPYLLSLNKGEAIKQITATFNELGYNWAYRIVDPRGFGIPQRRPRMIFLASKIMHPKNLLFSEDEQDNPLIDDKIDITGHANYGFYWTEGKIGIGWAKDSVPPIKGGSTIGIPSPPAIWLPKEDFFGTPTIEDAERLQGFPSRWTESIENNNFKKGRRWKLVGNAVNTSVSEWLGRKIVHQQLSKPKIENTFLFRKGKWPHAAYSDKNRIFGVNVSRFPESNVCVPISDFLKYPLVPLSQRATLGFHKRVVESTLIKYPKEFIHSLEIYLKRYG
jgi:DNA (cytosine-5)-methyltransferase 1